MGAVKPHLANLLCTSAATTSDARAGGPEDDRSFSIHLEAWIGSDDCAGVDAFRFTLCTPDRLESLYRERVTERRMFENAPVTEPLIDYGTEVVQLRPVFVTERWDVDALTALIDDLCARIDAETWPEVAAQLTGWFDWEYSYLLHRPRPWA